MRFETIDGLTLPKIGFGTWKIGGGSSADRAHDKASLAAMRSALELGYTHIDTAEMYGAGHCEEIVAQAIHESRIPRETLFIVSKVLPEHLHAADIVQACESSLRRLKTDYLDLYLIHWPSRAVPLAESFGALNRLVRDGKVRRLGVSNFSVELLKRSEELSETPILTDQVPYSLNDRTYAQNGVLAYCRERNILLTAYSPVDQGSFKISRALKSVAQAHKATPYQVALAWLVQQARVVTIPMSSNPVHQKENLEAADMSLSDSEVQQLG